MKTFPLGRGARVGVAWLKWAGGFIHQISAPGPCGLPDRLLGREQPEIAASAKGGQGVFVVRVIGGEVRVG
jgi:hypothetical protein